MNYIATFFIVVQSIIEFFIWKTDITKAPEVDSKILHVLSEAWIFTYFYTFAFYAAASFMNPGYLSINWLSEAYKDPNFKEELDDNGEKSFCEICNIPRPLRAHHCSSCKKCVLLMDHHCDFIGNCVGYRNYKCFFMFLISFCVHAILTITITLYFLISDFISPSIIVIFIISLFYFLLFGLLVVLQLIPQVKFATTNTTWIETTSNKVRDALYQRAKVKRINRYDTGSVFKNMQQRFGQNPFTWFLPIANSGNPYTFPENPKFVPVYALSYETVFDENGYMDSDENLMPAARFRKPLEP